MSPTSLADHQARGIHPARPDPGRLLPADAARVPARRRRRRGQGPRCSPGHRPDRQHDDRLHVRQRSFLGRAPLVLENSALRGEYPPPAGHPLRPAHFLDNVAGDVALRKPLVDFRLRTRSLCRPPPPGFTPRGPCRVAGNSRANVLRGTPYYDYICRRGGDDRIFAQAGADEVAAGSGRDSRVWRRRRGCRETVRLRRMP